jgi:hypothetical protein
MNPFAQPEQWFPTDITDRDGQPLGLGHLVNAQLGRRYIAGEIVGWRPPDRVRVLTESLHLHTVVLARVWLAGEPGA